MDKVGGRDNLNPPPVEISLPCGLGSIYRCDSKGPRLGEGSRKDYVWLGLGWMDKHTQGSRVRPIRSHMRPNFLRCELKLNEVAPVLLAGGRLKKKYFIFYFFLSPAVVVDNKIVLSGSFLRVHYSLSLPVSACLSVCTFYSLWSAHYTCTVLLHTQHVQKSKQSRYNMKRSIVNYLKKKNVPEEKNEAVV